MTVVLYLAGLHSDPAKLTLAQVIATVGGLGINIAGLVLGIRARRAEVPMNEEFGYGRAFGAGFMITLVSSVLGALTWLLYVGLINPEFTDVIVQAQVQQLEAKGLNAAQIEAAEKMIRTMSHPAINAVFAFFGGLFFGAVISLVAAAFLKRPAAEEFAPPPTLA